MTDAQLEQLWFTWARHGTENRLGFQVVAATPALLDKTNRRRSEALELCRYRAPTGARDRGEAPVSFGWTDRDDTRYVFHKVYTGTDAFGRPGNFAAHIVAGPRTMLPARELLARFRSPWWWTEGAAPDPELPRVTLSEIEPGSLDLAEAPELLAAALFTARRGRPVAIRQPPDVAVAIVAALAERVPWLADDISFSSYESRDTAARFEIVGMDPASQPPPASLVFGSPHRDTDAVEAARIVVSPERIDRAATSIGRSVVPDAGRGVDFGALADSVIAFHSLLVDGDIDRAKLRTALASAPGITQLARVERGVTALARAIVAGEALHWPALGQACTGGCAEKLGDEVATEILAAQDTRAPASTLQRLETELPALVTAVCVALCRKWAARQTPMKLDVPGAVAVLRGLRDPRTCDDEVLTGLAAEAARDPLLSLNGTGLGRAVRGRILAQVLRRTTQVIDLGALVSAEPELGQAAAPYLRRVEPLRELLGAIDVEAVPVFATGVLRELEPEAGYEFLASYADRLGNGERLTLLASCLPGEGRRSRQWSDVVRTALEGVIDEAMSAPRFRNPLTKQVCDLVETTRCGPVGEVLSRRDPGTPTRLSAELQLTLLLGGSPSQAELSALVDRLALTLPPEFVASALVDAAHRRLRAGPSAARVLVHLARMIAAGRLPTRHHRLRGRLDRDARDLARSCGQPELAAGRIEVAGLGGAAEAWWHRLTKPKRRWPIVLSPPVTDGR
ncbi:hypothetical protein [Amycolatopsis sp. NPDC051716]|uniref:GAP1-N2 domain-containing protein n=1 Tax=Amycolatopsis sp. NPDC051716 TaxID=3155804 RepID=UPI0034361DA6